jgi:PAS domain S-box-containing protein
LVIKLGEWVIEEALRQIAKWNAKGIKLVVSVNIDALHILNKDFVPRLSRLLSKFTCVSPQQLEIEILESSSLADLNRVITVMQACLAIGVRFSIDDFGTGFSSLTYLKQLPAEYIKVDKSFVIDMVNHERDYALVESIVSMSRAFNRKIIAEGVETLEHAQILIGLGCELGQGYGISKPLASENVASWMRQWNKEKKWSNIIQAELSIILGVSPHVISASSSIATITGFPSSAFIEGDVEIQELVHDADNDIIDKVFSDNSNMHGSFNLRLRHADKKIRCVAGRYSKRAAKDKIGTLLELQIIDSKSLAAYKINHHAMPNFNAMMENTDDYIYFKDSNHVFTAASQTLVDVTSPSEHWTDLIGLTDYDVFPEELADDYYELEKQIFSGAKVAQGEQETLNLTSGIKGWVDNRKYPILSNDGKIIGLFGVARDITQIKLKQEHLIQQKQHLEASIKSKTEELTVIALRIQQENEAKLKVIAKLGKEMSDLLHALIDFSDLFEIPEGQQQKIDSQKVSSIRHGLAQTLKRVKDIEEQSSNDDK